MTSAYIYFLPDFLAHVFFICVLVVLVCGSSECGYWVGKVPAAVFRAHNRPTKAFSWSFAARWHAFPFLMLIAIGCVFLWPTCRTGSCDQSIAVRSNNNADVSHHVVKLKQQHTCISLYMGTFRRSKSKFGVFVYRVLQALSYTHGVYVKQPWVWHGQTVR